MAWELVTGLLAVLWPGMATPGEGSFATRSVSRQGAMTTGSFVATLRVENPVRAGLVEAVCADEAVGAEQSSGIYEAREAGINCVDTADVYSQGESEQIVGKALKGHRDAGVLARKIHGPMPHVSGPSLSCSSSRRLAVLIALASSLVGYQRRCI